LCWVIWEFPMWRLHSKGWVWSCWIVLLDTFYLESNFDITVSLLVFYSTHLYLDIILFQQTKFVQEYLIVLRLTLWLGHLL
jgi:hypothetical protein